MAGAAFARARSTRSILVIDEYPYLAQSYPGISSLLQEHVDREKDASRLMLVLCGSSMSFMEHQVLGHQSPLYGRRTAQLKLEPFDCMGARLMLGGADPIRAIELYSLVGGVPLYLEQLEGNRTTEWNLANRILGLGRFLYAEPESFLLQEIRSPALYHAVIEAIAQGCPRPKDIENRCHITSSAVASYLKTLSELGIVSRVQPLGSRKRSEVSYRVCDYLFRFWHTFVPRYGQLVEAGMQAQAARRIVERDLSSYVGHVFEDVCRQWVVSRIADRSLDLLPKEIGTWWGTDPTKKTTTDVDVAVRGFDGELLVGECKWESPPVGSDVIGRLAHRAKLIDAKAEDVRLMVFAKNGFTGQCVDEARRRGNVTLVRAEDLFS
jgi:AAA+ ATPase superfamily predicted ATPase